MEKKKINIKNSKILIMGLTFKENCSDIRNSGVKMVYERLKKYTDNVDLYDPWADSEEIKKIYDINPQQTLDKGNYDGIIIAVEHKIFIEMGKIEILNSVGRTLKTQNWQFYGCHNFLISTSICKFIAREASELLIYPC